VKREFNNLEDLNSLLNQSKNMKSFIKKDVLDLSKDQAFL